MVDASPLIAIEERAETLRRGPQVGRDPSRRSAQVPEGDELSAGRGGQRHPSWTLTYVVHRLIPANVGHGVVIGDHEVQALRPEPHPPAARLAAADLTEARVAGLEVTAEPVPLTRPLIAGTAKAHVGARGRRRERDWTGKARKRHLEAGSVVDMRTTSVLFVQRVCSVLR